MEGYKVTVVSASIELSKKDKIRISDTTGAIAIDKATQDGELVIDPAYWAVLEVHNEKSQDKDYRNFIIADKNGLKFRTGRVFGQLSSLFGRNSRTKMTGRLRYTDCHLATDRGKTS